MISKSEFDNKINNQIRDDSNCIIINDKLVSFLYEIIRDHLPPGKVEEIVKNSEFEGDTKYSNGWLAKYAEYLAKRLR